MIMLIQLFIVLQSVELKDESPDIGHEQNKSIIFAIDLQNGTSSQTDYLNLYNNLSLTLPCNSHPTYFIHITWSARGSTVVALRKKATG